jgi:hypothetical protein
MIRPNAALLTQRWVLPSRLVKVHDDGAFRVYICSPPREHRPAHVHLEYVRGGEVPIKLGGESERPSLWQNHHMNAATRARHCDRRASP